MHRSPRAGRRGRRTGQHRTSQTGAAARNSREKAQHNSSTILYRQQGGGDAPASNQPQRRTTTRCDVTAGTVKSSPSARRILWAQPTASCNTPQKCFLALLFIRGKKGLSGRLSTTVPYRRRVSQEGDGTR
ncbi:unnamed protein product [Ectocarpus sp. 8 AP-2014]